MWCSESPNPSVKDGICNGQFVGKARHDFSSSDWADQKLPVSNCLNKSNKRQSEFYDDELQEVENYEEVSRSFVLNERCLKSPNSGEILNAIPQFRNQPSFQQMILSGERFEANIHPPQLQCFSPSRHDLATDGQGVQRSNMDNSKNFMFDNYRFVALFRFIGLIYWINEFCYYFMINLKIC